jgi:hypothetical protein
MPVGDPLQEQTGNTDRERDSREGQAPMPEKGWAHMPES